MKRCKYCGRFGMRLMEIRPRGQFACHDRRACGRRAKVIGQWVGVRVLRRRDLDGTEWTIRPRRPAPHDRSEGFTLICEYRQHRSRSWHPTVELAKAHRDDVVASWVARSLREYGDHRLAPYPALGEVGADEDV